MLVVMMETDASSIQWDSGCASATSFYEFTWRSLEILSERKSNIEIGYNAKRASYGSEPFASLLTNRASGTLSRRSDSDTVENRNGRTISWYVFLRRLAISLLMIHSFPDR